MEPYLSSMSSDRHSYILEPESAAEMGRLLLQDRVLTEAMGGLFPEHDDLSSVYSVLDIGCGPGGWATTVAQTFPQIKVTGIDISTVMIAFARTNAARLDLSNVSFERMNALEPLLFADNTFGIINIRLAVAWIPRDRWAPLLRECVRILKPGGILRLCEINDMGISTSAACDILHTLTATLLFKRGYGFSASGNTFCITPLLGPLLHEAGCQLVEMRPFLNDASFGTPLYQQNVQNGRTIFHGLRPAFLQAGLATEEELNRLRARMEEDFLSQTFRAHLFGCLIWGTKPYHLT